MEQQHIQAKLVELLRSDGIALWSSPYTTGDSGAGRQHMKELAEKYAAVVGLPLVDVETALENVRSQAVSKGKGNKMFSETQVATLDVFLPAKLTKVGRKRNLATKLDVTTQNLKDMICEKCGVKHIKLIFNGKTLISDKRLDEQNVKHNSKLMVVKESEPEERRDVAEVEKKARMDEESLQRTQKGFQILSERDGSEDPTTTPFLEIADQKGNPLEIPDGEKKALMLAMGFHEKGRALMKRKDYDAALSHLLQADEQFGKCGSTLLNTVDNYAVLQLDIVWCYRALEALSYLQDSKQRLCKAEKCFQRCYGEQQERLMKIKGSAGGEEVLFLRLYLLQSLQAYLEGHADEAKRKLTKVEDLYQRLCVDQEKMTQVMALGYSEQDARLGLRTCHGDVEAAVRHISQRKEEKEDLKKREQRKRRRRIEGINTLVELGFSKDKASQALKKAGGDVDRAYEVTAHLVVLNCFNTRPSLQMAYLGFNREMVEAALRLSDWEVTLATQLLLDNQGTLPTDLLSPSPPSSMSEEPSTSSESTASGSSDADLVDEVLQDIPQHEEDYLDLTLEEESDLIAQIKSFLEKTHAQSS
uniref:UBA domain-containing protein n=1 Tax=Denticeps clupeoides TaxID=299321 RepID=A0AAY4AMY9_9TELE